MSRALQERFDAFVGDFAAPLCAGGNMTVGLPLGARHLSFFTSGAIPASVGEAMLIDARDAVAADLLPSPPVLPPLHQDPLALRLFAIAHNVVALSHPAMARGPFSRATGRRVARFTAELLAGIERADTVREAVSMHTVLQNLPHIARTDRIVSYWAGTRRYAGQTPPHRMVRWPRLRRVSIKQERHSWIASEALSPEQRDLLDGLLRRSPITDIVNVRPGFRLDEAVLVLQEPHLARFVVDSLLGLGLDGEDRVGALLATALVEAIGDARIDIAAIRFYASLLVHLIISLVYISGRQALAKLDTHASSLLGVVGMLVEMERRGAGLGIPRLEQEADQRLVAVAQALNQLAGSVEQNLGGMLQPVRQSMQRLLLPDAEAAPMRALGEAVTPTG